jgi:electron transfer flavoprotein alpha subunit
MAYLKINHKLISAKSAAELVKLCPFNAISYENGKLDIGAGCKMCKLCVKKSGGLIEFIEEAEPEVDLSAWRGITVFGECHPVANELLGKAKELAAVTGEPVYALVIGYNVGEHAEQLLRLGADKVFVYDAPELEYFAVTPYANAFSDFIEKQRPSAVLVGATNLGRSLAPKVAARFGTGLTADCTRLEMRENGALVQIRPAFGGNIMAQIVTPRHRPQFCTVRYKIFSAPEIGAPHGEIIKMTLPAESLTGRTQVLEVIKKPKEVDLADADMIVAIGRGVKSKQDVALAFKLGELLGAQMACTRPLVEAGMFDAKHQIGLSGRTVKPKLIITIGISGSVQFAAGMRGSECIIAVNNDRHASIFDVAHYGYVGDLSEILPVLITQFQEVR